MEVFGASFSFRIINLGIVSLKSWLFEPLNE